MSEPSRPDARAQLLPLAPPPLLEGPTAGSEIDLPGGRDRRGVAPESPAAAEARQAALVEQRRLELGGEATGEEARARRELVRAWLGAAGGERRRDLLEDVRLCARQEAALARAAQGQRRELPSDIDPHNLRRAGWGVVLPEGARPGLREALEPLLAERRQAAGPLFRELAYRRGDSARRFLEERLGRAPGVLDPRRAPYYLLLAGGPEEIPFEVQYQLSLGHAVGRLGFDDLADWRRYASAVVAAEREGLDVPRRVAFFSTGQPGDLAAQRLDEHLVAPLTGHLGGAVAPWHLEVWGGEHAVRRDLARLLGGDATPGVLVAACHGMDVAFGAPGQQDLQGALVCRHPLAVEAPGREHCFAAEDLPAGARLHGLIALLLACYGAGTPVVDSFGHGRRAGTPAGGPEVLAPRPFLAALPRALLAHGALAVLGHVDRGWTVSFSWPLEGRIQEAAGNFEDVLRRLLTGQRLGHALRPIYRHYAALAAHAVPAVERLLAGDEIDHDELELLHLAIHDARNFILLGDPAVYATGRRVHPEASEEESREER